MENSAVEKLLKNVEIELRKVEEKELAPIDRLRQALAIIAGPIADLKDIVTSTGFANIDEEIYFFKHLKPRLYSCQIFELLIYNLCVQTPAGTPDVYKAYYEDELKQVFRFFRTEAFAFQYFKIKASELDHVYFVKDTKHIDTPMVDVIEASPGFSTAWDYKFAKFIAYERFRDLLIELLTETVPVAEKRKEGKSNGGNMKWTGDTINLVEIAYGIWLTGQINHGNAGIAEIVQFLETNFKVNIGRPFRRWQSISGRKRLSQVRYVDQMKGAILKRLDDENAK